MSGIWRTLPTHVLAVELATSPQELGLAVDATTAAGLALAADFTTLCRTGWNITVNPMSGLRDLFLVHFEPPQHTLRFHPEFVVR